jgi:DNA-directed RNA polymerase specialized sigma24 family protein
LKSEVDFHRVLPEHDEVHKRLLNWARTVADHPKTGWTANPIFRMAKSNAWQWHTPQHRETVDLLDGWKVEKLVSSLTTKHRTALRWCYVKPNNPNRAAKMLGVSKVGLSDLIHQARSTVKTLLTR